jgi:hypothetical protein
VCRALRGRPLRGAVPPCTKCTGRLHPVRLAFAQMCSAVECDCYGDDQRHVERNPFADPDAAARKLVEIANAVEAVQDGRIYIMRGE